MVSKPKKRSHKAQRSQRRLAVLLVILALTVIGGDLWSHFNHFVPKPVVVNQILPPVTVKETPGKLLSQTAPEVFSVAQVQSISHEDYGSYTPKAKYAVAKTVVTYRSYDTDGSPLTIHARIYQPVGVANAPVIAFAPGTTGLGNACAPSTEDPAKASYANYESHMLTYAGQGYAMVTTDYEGFLDPTRTMHHYMVGPLEGRAVLDSVRALINLDSKTKAIDTNAIFLAGYSQGGHAVLWANQIAPSYAPGLSIKGVVGFGAVVNVDETLEDVTQGANLSWFGPYVLVSYADYYHETYPLSDILLPKWIPNLKTDVLSTCINTDLEFWGTNPSHVYTPQFIQALKTHTLATAYPSLEKRMKQNNAATVATSTPILLNGGAKDIVVLPQQQANALTELCHNNPSDPVHLHEYPTATHYNTMAISFVDTLQWINQVRSGAAIPNDCSAATT